MVFLRGFHGTFLCTNGSAGYLMQLSVKAFHNLLVSAIGAHVFQTIT